MKNWQKYTNFRRYKNTDDSYTYIITINGEDTEVSEAIYREYAKFGRKIKYMEFDLKCDRVLQDADGKAVKDTNGNSIFLPEREISMEKLMDEDWDYPSPEPSQEDVVIKKLEIKTLHSCLELLATDERQLIHALFFDGLTEREYSQKTGIAQKTINDRKHRILKKLKNLL